MAARNAGCMMICHVIEPYKARSVTVLRTGKKQWKGKGGTPEHLAYIFDKALEECGYEEGDEVWYRKRLATVMNIHKSQQFVEWDGFKVKYIELWCPEQQPEFVLVHHSQISHRGRRK